MLLLMSKLVPVRALKDVNLPDVDFKNRENQLEGERIIDHFSTIYSQYMYVFRQMRSCRLGSSLTRRLSPFLKEETLTHGRWLGFFYKGTRAFFEKAVEYSLQSLPLNDVLLQNARFINFEQRMQADQLQAEYFVERWVIQLHVTCVSWFVQPCM